MRYGTGCCTSVIPAQVPLWCKTRIPDRLSLHTHAGVGLGSRRTRVATCLHVADPGLFMRACRPAWGSHHQAGSLGHADYGPALSWLSLGRINGAACVRLVLFQLPSPECHWQLAVRPRAGAVADLSKRTRRAATVRCRHMRPGAVLTRRWPSAMPTGARILVGQVRDYSRRPRPTRAWAPARGR